MKELFFLVVIEVCMALRKLGALTWKQSLKRI